MQKLTETSLTRIHQHTKNRNTGMVSAFRSMYDLSDNLRRTSLLEADIKSSGFAFIKMKGRYIEGYGTEGEKSPSDEISFLVIGSSGNDNGKLKGYMRRWGSEYNQDSVLYKPFDSDNAVLIGTTDTNEMGQPTWPGKGKEHSVGKFHPMRAGEFHTAFSQSSGDKLGKTPPSPKVFSFADDDVKEVFRFDSYDMPKTFFEAWSDFLRRKEQQV